MYLYALIDAWDSVIEKQKQRPPPGDDASTTEAVPGGVGRD